MEMVYLVHHIHEFPDGSEDIKLIGVYASEEEAINAVERARQLPGFIKFPEGFEISSHKIGRDDWTEGFVTIDDEGKESGA